MRSLVQQFLYGLVLLLLLPGLASAQTQEGTVAGTVIGAESGAALAGASLLIVESGVETAADVDGRYTIGGVATGTRTLRVSFVGYKTVTREVEVRPGETKTVDVEMEPTAKRIGEVVVTGVAQETPQANLSFSVDQVGGQTLQQVTVSSPVAGLQGKLPGVQVTPSSGEPGTGLSVNLRGANTLTGDNAPLFIVDGIILGADQVDLSALDVKNIEVVKGAAASSLYGSRAQNGVINITTKRGQDSPLGETRITMRSEVGIQALEETPTPNRAHFFKTNDNGQFIDGDGNPVNYGADLVLDTSGPHGTIFRDNPYSELRTVSGEPYDLQNPLEQFFDPGNVYTNYVAVSRNSQRTNFRASVEDRREGGVVQGPVAQSRGYHRKSFRLNLDHRPSEDVAVSASANYVDADSDRLAAADMGLFGNLFEFSPLADLTERDEQGELINQPDPRRPPGNPLYRVENAEIDLDRSRFLGNLRTEYSPVDWLTLEGILSYDRLDRVKNEFYKRGFKTGAPLPWNRGEVEEFRAAEEALNYSMTASFAEKFGKWTARSQLKYQGEDQRFHSVFIQGNGFATVGTRNFENIADQQSIELRSARRVIRSESVYVTANGNYDNRYIADVLVRRDGSSLFGEAERWQTYYRGSGAWRIGEEAFWPYPTAVNQFKLRYSYGTAGARPDFGAQYETYSLNDGNVSKSTLGNARLKPEFQVEQELGLDLGVYDRVFLTLNYVDTKVEDQLLRVPLSASLGFDGQWQNAGTVESTTWEASLDATILRTQDVAWDLGLTFDRTRQRITDFDRPAYRTGPLGLFFYRVDEVLGAMYGEKFVTSTSELQTMGLDPSKFQKNDDGYMVPVGQGNSWRDGFNTEACSGDGCWGTSVPTAIGDLAWGLPFTFVGQDGEAFTRIGSTVPDFTLNLSSNLSYGGFTAYVLLSYQHGGDLYNQNRYERDGPAQVSKPLPEKKPTAYYRALYNKGADNSADVEDGTFLKIRELSLGYRFDEAQLNDFFGPSNPVRQISLDVTGRNLFTMTDYSGLDPEVGSGDNPNVFRVDTRQYPPFREVTGRIEIQF